jgi:hypothetical protein
MTIEIGPRLVGLLILWLVADAASARVKVARTGMKLSALRPRERASLKTIAPNYTEEAGEESSVELVAQRPERVFFLAWHLAEGG